MTDKRQSALKKESRSEVRNLAAEDASISFRPPGGEWEYQIKLRNFSDSGLGFLVKENSDLLKLIHVGDVFTVNYYRGFASMTARNLTVQVRHISFSAAGIPKQHVMVGLYFLKRDDEK